MNAEKTQALIEHIETDLNCLRNITLKFAIECEKEDIQRSIQVNEIALAALTAQPIGRVDRGAVTDSNEYPDASVVCLHEHVGWEAFQDGTELFTRPAPAVSMAELVPDDYQHLKNVNELYHGLEQRLFNLAQKIEGPAFDSYAYGISQAVDVLESRIFGHINDDNTAAILRNIEEAK